LTCTRTLPLQKAAAVNVPDGVILPVVVKRYGRVRSRDGDTLTGKLRTATRATGAVTGGLTGGLTGGATASPAAIVSVCAVVARP